MSGANTPPRQRAALAALIGLIAFLVAAALLLESAQRDLGAQTAAARAGDTARALAAMTQASQINASTLPAAIDGFFKSQGDDKPTATRIVSLDQRLLIASTDPRDLAQGPMPRALSRAEKPLFDRGKALARTPGDGVTLASPRAGLALAIAPVRANGRIVGSAEVAYSFTPAPIGSFFWPITLAAAAVAVALLFVFGKALQRAGGVAAIGAVSVVVLLVSQLAPAEFAGGQKESIAALDAHRTATATQLSAELAVHGWPAATPAPAAGPSQDQLSAAQPDARDALHNSLVAAGLSGVALAAFIGFGAASALWRTLNAHRTAYLYLAPALIGMLVLSIFPFLYGVSLSVTNTTLLNQDQSFLDRFVGLDNYNAILADFDVVTGAGAQAVIDYSNFYWTFMMTVLWTVSNVAIGVTVGLALALLLNTKGLRGAGVYRTLLILPWAIPNYITALTWKGIFHPQFGSANQLVQAFGGEPVAWFDSVWPSFFTGVITNGWLSFPFMMVVCLGALQAIDEDMYEAARIDGANRWQRFRFITLPALMPALLPAVVVSVVWTFNMFNVIYLVSAGQPGGSTEILITRAYKVAFEEYRYGYAAAYSVVIFLILLIYSAVQLRMSKAMETAR
jgi:arabinogalactan oligomer / maltooligosaccharide transport system permease protein